MQDNCCLIIMIYSCSFGVLINYLHFVIVLVIIIVNIKSVEKRILGCGQMGQHYYYYYYHYYHHCFITIMNIITIVMGVILTQGTC